MLYDGQTCSLVKSLGKVRKEKQSNNGKNDLWLCLSVCFVHVVDFAGYAFRQPQCRNVMVVMMMTMMHAAPALAPDHDDNDNKVM